MSSKVNFLPWLAIYQLGEGYPFFEQLGPDKSLSSG